MNQRVLYCVGSFCCGVAAGLVVAIKYGEYVAKKPREADITMDDILKEHGIDSTESIENTVEDEKSEDTSKNNGDPTISEIFKDSEVNPTNGTDYTQYYKHVPTKVIDFDTGEQVEMDVPEEFNEYLDKTEAEGKEIFEKYSTGKNRESFYGRNVYSKTLVEFGLKEKDLREIDEDRMGIDNELGHEELEYPKDENEEDIARYVILTEDEFLQIPDYYDREAIQYLEGDDIYLDDYNRIIPNFDDYIGISSDLLEYNENDDAFLKADDVKTCYHIHKMDMTYAQFLGVDEDDDTPSRTTQKKRMMDDE